MSEDKVPAENDAQELKHEVASDAQSAECNSHRVEQIDVQTEDEKRALLISELDEIIDRLEASVPEYTPPSFSPQGMIRILKRNIDRFSPYMGLGVLKRLRKSISEDLLDIDTWKGIWFMVNYTLEYQADILRRRLSGEYETDEWGFDQEFLQTVEPFIDFMYSKYWRIETSGMDHIPDEGRAMLVSNHSGQLPWDGLMLSMAVYKEHSYQRLVRTLYEPWIPTLPFLSDFRVKLGQVMAHQENGERLLEDDELISVFPEGNKGRGKLYKNRYHLARFGQGEFIQMAIRTRAPIIPVSIVGAEETYITLGESPTAAKLFGVPFFPISPTFPWLGPFGFVPLPTKWYIDIGETIQVDEYEPVEASNLVLVSQLSDQVRSEVRSLIYQRLAQRRSIFFS